MLPPGPSRRSYISSSRSGLLLTVHALLRADRAKSICTGAFMPAGVWLHRGAPDPAAAVSDGALKDSGMAFEGADVAEEEELEEEDVVESAVVAAYPARRGEGRLRRARRLRARPARHGWSAAIVRTGLKGAWEEAVDVSSCRDVKLGIALARIESLEGWSMNFCGHVRRAGGWVGRGPSEPVSQTGNPNGVGRAGHGEGQLFHPAQYAHNKLH